MSVTISTLTPLPCEAGYTGKKASPSHRVLFNSDLLVMIFSFFNSTNHADRTACVHSALVCHAWTETASRVLWKRLDWWLLPLYNVLTPAPRISPLDPEVREELIAYCDRIKEEKPYNDPVRWANFLRCANRVRMIEISLLPESELDLIKILLERNNNTTFLSRLRSMFWAPLIDSQNLLFELLPPHLEELNIHGCTDLVCANKGEDFLARLPSVIPFVRTLSVDMWSSLILRCAYLREFTLHEMNEGLTPSQFKQLVALPHIQSVSLTIKDFQELGCDEIIEAPHLQELRCKGSCDDLQWLIQSLRAPALWDLLFDFDRADATYGPSHEVLFRTFCNMPLAQTVTSLGFFISHEPAEAVNTLQRRSTLPEDTLLNILKPFLPLKRLETFKLVVYSTALSAMDTDILRVAQAWPNMVNLLLAFTPGRALPTTAALAHFAGHCHALRTLYIELDNALHVALPAAPPYADHPLQMLELSLDFSCAGEKVEELARLYDMLFPNLDVDWCVEQTMAFPWDGPDGERSPLARLWTDVRRLQMERRPGASGVFTFGSESETEIDTDSESGSDSEMTSAPTSFCDDPDDLHQIMT